MNNANIIIDELVLWLQTKVKTENAKGLVFGLSGGIDSAVIAGIAKLAFPETSLGIIMPCHSDIEEEQYALLVAEAMKLENVKVDLNDSYDIYLKSTELHSKNKLSRANIKSKLRITTLYYYAEDKNYLVLGSSNKSEFVAGYFTKNGDSGVDLLPLANFVKSEIRELARFLNIPELVIDGSSKK